jgi:uncharacterized membrane protein HdeD (DUF308 family)
MLLIRSILTKDSLETMGTAIECELTENKKKYIIRGVAFIGAGIIAMLLSARMTFRGEQILGAALALAGIAQLASFLWGKAGQRTWLYSLLFVGVGVMIVWQPSPLMLAAVIVLSVLMTLEGLLEIYLALRRHPINNWGWIFFAGFITLSLASVIWLSIPSLNATALYLIVSINLIIYGVLLLILVWQTSF